MKLISGKDIKELSQRLASKINDFLLEEFPTIMLEFDEDNTADIDDIDNITLGLEEDIRDIIIEELKTFPETEEE
jgi:hypothetical protein